MEELGCEESKVLLQTTVYWFILPQNISSFGENEKKKNISCILRISRWILPCICVFYEDWVWNHEIGMSGKKQCSKLYGSSFESKSMIVLSSLTLLASDFSEISFFPLSKEKSLFTSHVVFKNDCCYCYFSISSGQITFQSKKAIKEAREPCGL